MQSFKRIFLAGLLVATLPMIAACEREGPAERAGKSVDRATERTGEAIQDTGRAIERKANP